MSEIFRARPILSLWLIFAAVSVSPTAPALAGAFSIETQSPYSLGTANAGAAAGGALSTVFWNPAALGDVKSVEAEGNLAGIEPTLSVLTNSFGPFHLQRNADVGVSATIPAASFAYRINPKVVLGLSVNTPFGLGTRYSPSTSYLPLLGIAGETSLVTINVTPNIAYQISDQLTLAVGVQGQYFSLQQSAFGAPTSKYQGSSRTLGFGYTLGALWKPSDNTRIGIGFRSGVTNLVQGAVSGVNLPSGSLTDLDARLKLRTPSEFSLGVSRDLSDIWTLKFGVTRMNWSSLDSVSVTGAVADNLGLTSIPLHYQDSCMVSIGAEYRIRSDLTARLGMGYETSPLNIETRNFWLPDSNRLWLTTGFSKRLTPNYVIDFGYAFVKAKETKIAPAGSGGPLGNGPFSGSAQASAQVLSLGLRASF